MSKAKIFTAFHFAKPINGNHSYMKYLVAGVDNADAIQALRVEVIVYDNSDTMYLSNFDETLMGQATASVGIDGTVYSISELALIEWIKYNATPLVDDEDGVLYPAYYIEVLKD